MESMTQLEKYKQLNDFKQEEFERATRKCVISNIKTEEFKIGPTNKGGIFLKLGNKEIGNTFTTKNLSAIRDTINEFLVQVCENDYDN